MIWLCSQNRQVHGTLICSASYRKKFWRYWLNSREGVGFQQLWKMTQDQIQYYILWFYSKAEEPHKDHLYQFLAPHRTAQNLKSLLFVTSYFMKRLFLNLFASLWLQTNVQLSYASAGGKSLGLKHKCKWQLPRYLFGICDGGCTSSAPCTSQVFLISFEQQLISLVFGDMIKQVLHPSYALEHNETRYSPKSTLIQWLFWLRLS